jgi:hypothetical protein
VRLLSEDLKRLSRRGREKVDVLGALEARVTAMRAANMHGQQARPWADRAVDVSANPLLHIHV